MCEMRMEDKGGPSSSSRRNIHEVQEAHRLHHHQEEGEQQSRQPTPLPPLVMQYNLTGVGGYGGGGCDGFFFPSEPAASVLPWSFPQAHPITAANFSQANGIHMPQAPSWAPGALQFGCDSGVPLCTDPLGLAGLYLGGSEGLTRGGGIGSALSVGAASSPFAGLGAEFGKMNAQEIMDAKALAASKSHSEAERRRRERINTHLAKLRSLLPSTTKTDKASLLAEVIQHVKELKRQTTEIAEESPVPTESDELTVDSASDEEGRFIVRASLCCEDRSDLLPDLIKALKSLKLRALKAEITTLGGRVRNVLVIASENDDDTGDPDFASRRHQSIATVHEALKAVMERTSTSEEPSSATAGGGSGGGVKRQRTTGLSSILEHTSI